MKKTELMMGALVSLRGDEAKRIKVNGITKKKIQYINEKKQPEYLRYSQLVPIQLNDLFIKDLGFERRKMKIGSQVVDDWILILFSKKDENNFYKITIQADDSLGIVDKCRSVHIENSKSMNVGFGYVRDIHELQSLVQSTTKLCLDVNKLLCGNL